MELVRELRGERSENTTSSRCDTRPSLLCPVHAHLQGPSLPGRPPRRPCCPGPRSHPHHCCPPLSLFLRGPLWAWYLPPPLLWVTDSKGFWGQVSGLRGPLVWSLCQGPASPVWGNPRPSHDSELPFTDTQQSWTTAQPHTLETIQEVKAPSLGHLLLESFLICFRKAHPK